MCAGPHGPSVSYVRCGHGMCTAISLVFVGQISCFFTVLQCVSFIILLNTRLSRDVLADAGFLCQGSTYFPNI